MDRPTAWLAGAGVGLCLVSGVGLVALAAGLTLPWWAYLAWFGFGLGGTVAWEYGAGAVVYLRTARADLYGTWQRHEAQEIENRRRAAELEQAAAGGDEADDGPRRAAAVGVWRFMLAGNALGFALDGLVAAGVVTQPTWQRLKDFYLIYPESGPVLADRGGNVGTVWAPSWSLGRVGDELALGEFPLPPGAPPDVGVYIPSQHNAGKRTKRTAGAVIIDQKSTAE